MSVLHIWPSEPRSDGEKVHLEATIERPEEETVSLWFRIPASQAACAPENSDHFVLGTLFLLMRSGVEARVHGQVSPSLMRNLVEFQAAWSAVRPDLRCVDIVADHEWESEELAPGRPAIMAFSGGVDSCFTAYRHARGAGVRLPRELATGVMVQGFDIPLGDDDAFAAAARRSQRLLSSLGLAMIPMATNYKDVVGDWNHSHGAAIAACLSLFSRGYSEGLIAQTFTYGEIREVVEGVNALTDPLLSSDSFRIVPDGAAFERSDKIHAMSDWDEFLQNLRVCWEGPRKDRNCCACEKCMRTILTFRALGLGLPPCFDRDLDDEQVRTLRIGPPARARIRYGSLPEIAAGNGAAGPWTRILERRLAAQRRRETSRTIRTMRRVRSHGARLWARMRGEA